MGKFDLRSHEAVFIGYSPHCKAYKVYDKRTIYAEESVHVIFDETDKNSQQVQVDDDEDLSPGMYRETLDALGDCNAEKWSESLSTTQRMA